MRAARRIVEFAALLLLGACAHHPQPGSTDALVQELLTKLDSADYYLAKVEERMAERSRSISSLTPGTPDYTEECLALASSYSKLATDSTIVYYDKAAESALRMGDDAQYYKALLRKAHILISSGYAFVGKSIVDAIPKEKLDTNNLAQYFNTLKALYHNTYLSLDSKPALRAEFVSLYEQYRDSVLSLIPSDNMLSMREKERKCAREGDFDQALKYNYMRLERISDPKDPHRAAILYDRYIIYRHYMGRPLNDHIELLLESAILDVVSANQDIASFRYVEAYLNSIGAVDEAKKISDYYYSTMVRLGSRSRLISDSDLNRRINEQYSLRLERQNREIKIGLLLILLLAGMLSLILVLQLRSQAKIVRLNQDLERSGKTANSYVLGFFQLYSSYITRLQALRAKINTSTRKGNIKAVLDLTDPSKDITNDELKQMYQNFDRAFLDIFPSFVQDFNSLLRPECRIELKPTELLNMELRIFAIIKLGITDSAKISELLHCSIKTVYNKRSGINSKLLVQKDDFSEKLAKL